MRDAALLALRPSVVAGVRTVGWRRRVIVSRVALAVVRLVSVLRLAGVLRRTVAGRRTVGPSGQRIGLHAHATPAAGRDASCRAVRRKSKRCVWAIDLREAEEEQESADDDDGEQNPSAIRVPARVIATAVIVTVVAVAGAIAVTAITVSDCNVSKAGSTTAMVAHSLLPLLEEI